MEEDATLGTEKPVSNPGSEENHSGIHKPSSKVKRQKLLPAEHHVNRVSKVVQHKHVRCKVNDAPVREG